MEDRLVLDTDILIDFLRNKTYAVDLVKSLETKKELATTVINAFELFHGAFKSRNQEKNLASAKGLLNVLLLFSTSKDAMEIAAKLLTDLETKGKSIDIRDLFISSVCLVNSASLATRNTRHFENIKGLDLMAVGQPD